MNLEKRKELDAWLDTLSIKQLKNIAHECIDELIDGESISFWPDTKVPYWSNSGNRLDGVESVADDED